MANPIGFEQHNKEIQQNLEYWKKKPLLSRIYFDFYAQIATYLHDVPGLSIVELGSGIGNIKEVIPNCIKTDIFANPWIDQVENAYSLSFSENSVANLILFDIFHHLRYPQTALDEFHRVLAPHGRVVIFEPCISLLGLTVFGLLHHEPLGLGEKIDLIAPVDWNSEQLDYYAAQGNASRLFLGSKVKSFLSERWDIHKIVKMSAISYVASGGYSKPQLYPDSAFNLMKKIDRVCDLFPALFATRLLVVLEKK